MLRLFTLGMAAMLISANAMAAELSGRIEI